MEDELERDPKKTKIDASIERMEFGDIDEHTKFHVTFPENAIYVLMKDNKKEALRNITFGAGNLIKVLQALGINHQITK